MKKRLNKKNNEKLNFENNQKKNIKTMLYLNKEKFFERLKLYRSFLLYQALTKSIIFGILIPLFGVVFRDVLKSLGRTSISSGDFLDFLFTFRGAGLLFALILSVVIMVVFDVNVFILSSYKAKVYGKIPSIKEMIILGAKSIISSSKNIIFPGLYILFSFSLLGINFSKGSYPTVSIPSFVKQYIFSKPNFLLAYTLALLVIFVVLMLFVFTFHFLILKKYSLIKSMKSSLRFEWKNKKSFVIHILLGTLLKVIILKELLILLVFKFTELALNGSQGLFQRRFFGILIPLTGYELNTLIAFMIVPYIIVKLTDLFVEKDNDKVEKFETIKRYESNRIQSYVLFGLILINIASLALISYYLSKEFDSIYKKATKVNIVAHRAGGELDVENSLNGLKKAIEAGAQFSEIDIQRTKDGKYVVNHDNTFLRLAGDKRASYMMNLSEIKELTLIDSLDRSSKVATLEEMIDASKDKITLMIELKGDTADGKMADDVVKLLKEKKVKAILLSLDYNLIKYIEEKYPEVDTGYLYYFSFGDISNFKADYLIMEEGEATQDKIYKVRDMGRKPFVWTVNGENSMVKFIDMEVEGIITDYPDNLKSVLDTRDTRSDFEIITDSFFITYFTD